MAKFDLKGAYRLLPVREDDRHLLGMRWRGNFYVDLALPFGLRSACQIFSRFGDVLQSLFEQQGIKAHVQHYLDDYLLVGRPNTTECRESLKTCFEMCSLLGVPLAEDKTDGPATKITFLGFELDSEKLELSLPEEKVRKIRECIRPWAEGKAGKKRELLSLLGRLQHCCQAIVMGRPFLRRLIDRAHSVKELHHHVRLSRWELDDISWWSTLFSQWNGRSLFFFRKWELAPDSYITSDAAGSIGYAAICGNTWFAARWPPGVDKLNIAIKELVPIVLAGKMWGESWKRKRILFKCDNMAVVQCLKNGTCRDRHLAYLLRELSILAILANFTFTAVHLPGVKNQLADALSRFDFQAFFEAVPTAAAVSEEIPQNFLHRLLFPPWTNPGST